MTKEILMPNAQWPSRDDVPMCAHFQQPGSSRRLRFTALVLAWFWLLSFATAFAAQRKPGTPAPTGDRFLFVVETSNAMLPFEHAGRQAVFDLVYFGIGDQIRAGDSVGLWTFGEDAHAGTFPMQVWVPDQNLRLASLVGLFVKNQRYESQGRLDRVTPKVLSLIQAIRDVNVLIVSAPEHTWIGTAFDDGLNLAFKTNAVASHDAKRPLITTLVARKGAIISWSVTLAGDAISLPKPAPPQLVQVASNNAPAAVAPRPSTIRSIEITSAGLVTNGEARPKPVRAAPRSEAPAASVTQPQPAALTTGEVNTDVKVAQEENPVPNVAPAQTPSSTPAPEQPKPEPASNLVGAPPENKGPAASQPVSITRPEQAAIPMLTPRPMPIAAREKPSAADAPNSAAPALAMATPPQPFFNPRNLFLIGASLTVAAFALFFLALRWFRPTPKPSFITRSFERDGG